MLKKLSKEGRFECGLDDIVAGKVWAFTPGNHHECGKVGLGVAIANERGFHPVPLTWCNADSWAEIAAHADELNRAEGFDEGAAERVVISTMRGERVAP